MQWAIIPPLVLGFYFVVWKSQAATVDHDPRAAQETAEPARATHAV